MNPKHVLVLTALLSALGSHAIAETLTISLWSRHPFPSLVEVPEFPEVALDDVWRTRAKLDDTFSFAGNDMGRPAMLADHAVVKRLTIDEKIQFWRWVMQHAGDQGIHGYFNPGDYDLAIGLFDRTGGKERPVEFALKESARDSEGYYRVGTVPVSAAAIGGEAGWTSLFNGQNMDGWIVKCRPADQDKIGYWKVEDGTITAETPPGSKHHYIWLLTEEEYGDFTLRLKVQTYSKSTGNSGIQVRSRYDDDAGWLDGPQVDINPPGTWRNGFIYDETRGVQVWLWPNVGKPANAKPEHAPQGSKWWHADDRAVWNEVQVTCRETRITTVVNGVTIADYDGAGRLDDETHRIRNVGMKGHIGLQIHPGDELRIRFKDIEVRQP